jgi:Rps23 Pro-64 3,4-dihydroxylase Tpa1-like proline 4-hydroxylase
MHISAHIYPPSGFLLCHDDDIAQSSNGTSRRVAFILYLVEEDWSSKDGGALELYELKDGVWHIPVQIHPEFGLFALFRVGEDSLHRVGEVVGTRDRVSIR